MPKTYRAHCPECGTTYAESYPLDTAHCGECLAERARMVKLVDDGADDTDHPALTDAERNHGAKF